MSLTDQIEAVSGSELGRRKFFKRAGIAGLGVAAHLFTKDDVKRCSICSKEFLEGSTPSISKAFAAHVREEHQRIPLVQKSSLEATEK